MKAAVTLVLAILLVALKEVKGFSSGAPSSACSTLSPDPGQHLAQAQQGAVPYSIDLAPLTDTSGVAYTPGQTYTLTLSGNSGEQFRGFLIQTRTVADDSMVGSFAVRDSSISRLSSCSPSNIGITHSIGGDKMSVSFDWTAPSAGTGAIRFRFAVVQVRNTYWADQSSAMVQELVADTPTTTMAAQTTGATTNGGGTTDGEATTTRDVAMTTATTAVDDATTTVVDDATTTQVNNMPTDGALARSGFCILVLITTLLGLVLARAL